MCQNNFRNIKNKYKMLKLGAIKKFNDEYENVCNAKKENEYKCPECESDVILRKGTKNRIHFAHKKESNCQYYEHPSESEIHKEGKRVIKMLLEKNELNIYKKCQKCGEKEFIKIIYSTYTPAVKECIKRYREKNKEKINQQTLENYHKKMQDPDPQKKQLK